MIAHFTLPEQLLLLSLTKLGGIKQTITGYKSFIEAYLNAAVIIDLIIQKKISIENQYLITKDNSLSNVDYYDYIIKKTSSFSKLIKLNRLISKSISWSSKTVFNMLIESLSNKKAINKTKSRFLLIFNKTLFIPDLKFVDSIIQQIRAEILEEGKVEPLVVALVLLLDQSKLLKSYFSDYERDDLNKKINDLKKDNSKESNEIILIIESIKQVIDSINTAAMLTSVVH